MLETDRLKQSLKFALNIRPDRLAEERELVEHKWFDYRFDSPLDATTKFAEAYSTVYREKWEQHFDRDEAPKKRPIRVGGVTHDRREFTSLWCARQKADLAGAPYDFFVRQAIEWHLRSAWKRLPRPNQLICNVKGSWVLDHIRREWQQSCDARFHYSRLPHYRNENFLGLPAQIAHREHLIQQISKRIRPTELVGRLVFGERVLPEELAVRSFGEDMLKEARQDFTGHATPVISPSSDELRPPCYMLPYANTSASPTCASCSFKRRCGAAAVLINSHIQKRCGGLDPVTARERRLNRERVALHRAKKKTLSMSLSA